jgi:hypothetical protein
LQDILVLFKYYWYDIDRGIKVNPYYGMVEIHKRDKFRNINKIYIFLPNNANKCFINTLLFRKDHNRVDWLSVVKTKPKLCPSCS